MVEKDGEKYLVVVCVLKGRKFPKRAKYNLIVEARFDGELLLTDPVDHVELPDFTQELAWELDKKALHQHRLQRSSIKVQVYCQDVISSVREAVGYIILDLRSAGLNLQQNVKWYPLLHTKYQRSKPEVQLSLYIDDQKSPTGLLPSNVRPNEAFGSKAGTKPIDPRLLQPVLDKSAGYYQIGPVEAGSDRFVFSVAVALAANLVQLVPTNIALPSTGYFFHYTLLGTEITTQVFYDLLNPKFDVDRASAHISSSVEMLQMFFDSQPGLEIHHVCGDQSLGSCEVPLNKLLRPGSTEIFMKPVSIEATYQLFPPKSAKLATPAVIPEEQKPVVGISVVLKKDNLVVERARVNDPSPLNVPDPEERLREELAREKDKPKPTKYEVKKQYPSKSDKTHDSKVIMVGDGEPAKNSPPESSPHSPPTPHEGSYTETFESRSRSDDEGQRRNGGKSGRTKSGKTQQIVSDSHSDDRADGNEPKLAPKMTEFDAPPTEDEVCSDTQHQVLIPAKPHHFSVSIDLRCVAGLNNAHPINIFLKYTYMFFGSTSPIVTQPPVEVRRGTEVRIPRSFCAFDFATTFQQLEETFTSIPLIVEVWQKDSQMSQNVCYGIVQISLKSLLRASKTKTTHKSGSNGWKQSWSDWMPITTTDPERQHLGELQVSLSLEDWGPIVPQTIALNSKSQDSEESQMQSPGTETKAPNIRGMQEYKVAMELEVWKEQQQRLFEAQLLEKEKQFQKIFEEEYKSREKDRVMLSAKQKGEYDKLKVELRKTLDELEKRTKLLSTKEEDLARQRNDLQREHDRKMTQMREASQRLEDDCKHQVAMEKKKVADLEEMIVKLKQMVAEEEAKRQKLGREFESYKEKQSLQPEVRLQAEITQLTMEKVALEKQLDAVSKAKIHYKQQWGRALKMLARYKEKDLKQARAEQRRQKLELDHMRVHYMAGQEKNTVSTDKKELDEVKKELNQLKDTHIINKSNLQNDQTRPANGVMMNGESEEDIHIARLIEERDLLLRTGVYTSQDSIIANLDQQIRISIASKNRSAVPFS